MAFERHRQSNEWTLEMLIVAKPNAQCIVTQTGTLLSIRNWTLLVTRVEWFFFLLLSL